MTYRDLLPLLLSPLLLACDAGQDLGQRRFGNCAPCHGAQGGGNPAIAAPAIAGLPGWYVEAQLRKFQLGARGAHPDDEEGLRMGPMARTLSGEEDLKAISAHVAKLPRVRSAPTIQGDAQRGKTLYATCAACHGPRGEGMQALGAADLHVPGDWYLLAQLKKFKGGVRGANPKDTTGAQMRPMASTLPDEAAMRDVIAHISTLSP